MQKQKDFSGEELEAMARNSGLRMTDVASEADLNISSVWRTYKGRKVCGGTLRRVTKAILLLIEKRKASMADY